MRFLKKTTGPGGKAYLFRKRERTSDSKKRLQGRSHKLGKEVGGGISKARASVQKRRKTFSWKKPRGRSKKRPGWMPGTPRNTAWVVIGEYSSILQKKRMQRGEEGES